MTATFEELADLALAWVGAGDAFGCSRHCRMTFHAARAFIERQHRMAPLLLWAAGCGYCARDDDGRTRTALATAMGQVRRRLEAFGDSPSRNALGRLRSVREPIAADAENRWPV